MEEDKRLRAIQESLMRIEIILRGDPESDEPGGVIYSVSKNTSFRENFVKFIWILLGANAGILTYLLIVTLNNI